MESIEHAHVDGDHHHHLGDEDHPHDHEHEHEALTPGEVQTFKIVFMFVYFFITFLGMLPRVLGSCRNSPAVLSFMNCFAGGVFLAIGLIHLIPEGGAQFDEWAAGEVDFPLFYTLIFVGYLLALAVDRIIFKDGQQPVTHSHDDAKAATGDKANYEPAANDSQRKEVVPLEIEGTNTDSSTAGKSAEPQVWNSKAAAICVAVALVFQVLKEGIGFGGEEEIESGYQVASALTINSATISLALGSTFTKANFSTRQVLLGLVIFAFVAPICLIIGMAAGSGLPLLMNVILLSLATGIYFYFACSEVFVKEFANGKHVLAKLIAIVIAVLIILGLVFIESGHDHGNESDLTDVCNQMLDHGHDH